MERARDIGEFALIRRLTSSLPKGEAVVLPIGDDCAVLRASAYPLLLSCDLAVEGIHFRRETASAEAIGWKAAAAALSDIAAMGGTPVCLLVSMACADDTDVAFAEELYCGLEGAASAAGAVIAGGDTTRSPSGLVIDVAVVGEAREGRYVTRRGAQSGDMLAVTGFLGRSAAGLDALERGVEAPALTEAHWRPTPRYDEGRWLCRRQEVRAMIDVSDGLLQDAGHLAEAAGLGIDVQSSALPADETLAAYGARHGLDVTRWALAGGEDYELAVAIAPDAFEEVSAAFREESGLPLSAVGVFTETWAGVRVDGAPTARRGYDHFAR
ncbi:MAG TPA: thiamine-phosphate kinase [Candidatus Hydrogenedentes bacterium]|nr:thiamine-phosphate kinase [Candidatus Hydrogenedentota bacterium]HPG69209.1 thiamine-phosphate kinase [Candidatus Hydrogenedentota bacterium]